MTRLFSNLESFGNSVALVCQDGSELNYRELAERADLFCRNMAANPGLLALEASNDLESILALIGACRANCPVLLLGPGDLEQKSHIQGIFRPDYIFRGEEGAKVIEPQSDSPERERYYPELALMLSTSGSAGSAKLVRLSHQNLISNAHSIIEYLDLKPEDRAVTNLPLHYSFGLSILTSHLLCGASLLSTSLSIVDEEIWELLETKKVSSLSGVPRTYEILAQNGFLDRDLPDLKTMTQAGGKLEPHLVELFANKLSKAGKRFFVMYGQTEASPRISYLPPDYASSDSDSIGQSVPGGRIRIVDSEGNDIEQANTPGELVYEGPNVMMGYATCREDLAKGQGPSELKTGDIVIRKENGLFKIVGRASRFVKLAGLRISLDDVERIVKEDGTACLATGDDRQLLIAIEQGDESQSGKLKEKIAQKLKIPLPSVSVLPFAELPLLPSGKPDYVSVKNEAKRQADRQGSSDLRSEIATLLGRDSLQDHETFYNAGGDSLSYIEANFLVEKHFGQAVPSWEKIPFGKLFALDPDTDHSGEVSQPRPLDSLFIARSIAIALAMVSHAFLQFKVWGELPEFWRLFTRAATPTFLIIFGIGLARNYSRRAEAKDLKLLASRFLPKAATIYLAIVANLICSLIGKKLSFQDMLEALLFMHGGRFIDILALYCVLYALMPFVVKFIEERRFTGIWVLIVIPWTLWPFLHEIDSQSYLLSFLFGIGQEVGPSVPYALTFCLFGYAMGAKVQKDGRGKDAVYILLLAFGALFFGLTHEGISGAIEGIGDISLRRENHPLYFAFGILSAIVILLLAKGLAKFTKDSENAKLAFGLGANSIFSFTFGNMVLNLGPTPYTGLLPGLALSAAFMLGLTMITYDISRPKPRFFGPITRWIQRGFRTILFTGKRRSNPRS
ncbi:non-ribosomal peptide synthetase [Pelagicoccus albus]|uniref:AMP-binding protein n=1 Tax=Pelagicoccus albus TaxID=415222 RepID=A0A7X1E862_9BACT|nr:non-ribosomal peptide synthetase [Pelagicoccus albus]MBC2605931.1 AMP-binding protein [Pelagicoccus albus]